MAINDLLNPDDLTTVVVGRDNAISDNDSPFVTESRPTWHQYLVQANARFGLLDDSFLDILDKVANLIFLDLVDTPGDYTGDAGKVVVVNPGEDGLDFAVAQSLVKQIQAMVFNKNGNWPEETFAHVGDVLLTSDIGIVACGTGTITRFHITRTNTASGANMEVFVNGVFQVQKILGSSKQESFNISVSVSEGDRVQVFRQDDGNPTMNSIVTLCLEY